MKEEIDEIIIKSNALSIYDRSQSGKRLSTRERKYRNRFRNELRKHQGRKLRVIDVVENQYKLKIDSGFLVVTQDMVQSIFYSKEYILFNLRKILKNLLVTCKRSECGSKYKKVHHDCNRNVFAEFLLEYVDMGRAFLLHFTNIFLVEHAIKENNNSQLDIMHRVYPYFVAFYGEEVWEVLEDFRQHRSITWLYKQKETIEIKEKREVKRIEEVKKGKEVFDRLTGET